MKVLFYSLNYAPELTATGKYTGEMAAWFAGRGHEVHAIVGMPHYPQWALLPEYEPARYFEERLDEVHLMRVPHYIPKREAVSAASRIRMELSFIWKSTKYWLGVLVSRKRYDLVVVICPPLFTSIPAILYRLIRRVPWVIHVQDIQTDVAISLGLIKSPALKRLLYTVERFVLRRALLISTISDSMKRRLEEKTRGGSEVVLAPNWCDAEVLRGPEGQNVFRRDNGIPENRSVVMYSGNLGEKQGVEIIIEVAAMLEQEPDIHFVIVGDGVAKDAMVSMAESRRLSNITFLPVQDRKFLPSMLHAADLHLVVQKQGTFSSVLPSKLANIFAAGKPCIATAQKGSDLEELILSNRLGLTVEAGNTGELAVAITELVADPGLSREMSNNAREFAAKHLDMNEILGCLERSLGLRLS